MSELELQRRREYKYNRKKWTIIQLIAIFLLLAIALGAFWIYNRLNRTYYIEYTERGSAGYKVQYEENEFFEKEWIDAGQTYISSLTEKIAADFCYRLNAASSELAFKYQYKINAKLLVESKMEQTPYYTYEENILPSKNGISENTHTVKINESVKIDYKKFNKMAHDFINAYDLKDYANAYLIVTLDIEILSSNEKYKQESQNRYTTSLNIPLALDSFNIYSTSSSPDNAVKVLQYQDVGERELFFVIGTVGCSLDALLVLALLVFLHLTKNEDITYAARVRKLLRSYGSFIQRINGEFDCDGYQLVEIKSFTELLGIRDTIQSPVLMSENRDETMTQFLIPTNTKILYMFEIKVDNYDEIYGRTEENSDLIDIIEEEEPIVEAVEAVEPVVEETVEEPVEEPAPIVEETVEEPVEEPTPVEEPAPVEAPPAPIKPEPLVVTVTSKKSKLLTNALVVPTAIVAGIAAVVSGAYTWWLLRKKRF